MRMCQAYRAGEMFEPMMGRRAPGLADQRAVARGTGILHRLVVCAMCLLAFAPRLAPALELGPIEARSALYEPLDAQIPVRDARSGDLEGLRVELGSPAQFELAGVARLQHLDLLEFVVVEQDDGSGYIHVRTDEPIIEPLLTFLVDVDWPRGRTVRGYRLRLAPSIGRTAGTLQSARAAQEPRPSSETGASGADTSETDTSEASPVSPPASGGTRYGPVRRSETLWSIAARLRPDDSVSVQRMMLAILEANPEAFAVGERQRAQRGLDPAHSGSGGDWTGRREGGDRGGRASAFGVGGVPPAGPLGDDSCPSGAHAAASRPRAGAGRKDRGRIAGYHRSRRDRRNGSGTGRRRRDGGVAQGARPCNGGGGCESSRVRGARAASRRRRGSDQGAEPVRRSQERRDRGAAGRAAGTVRDGAGSGPGGGCPGPGGNRPRRNRPRRNRPRRNRPRRKRPRRNRPRRKRSRRKRSRPRRGPNRGAAVRSGGVARQPGVPGRRRRTAADTPSASWPCSAAGARRPEATRPTTRSRGLDRRLGRAVIGW